MTASVHRSTHWTVVEVEGEMDLRAAPLVMRLVDGDATCVVFDLHRVTFMDAGGLGLMVHLQRAALAAGGGVRVVAPSLSARRLLTLAGCDRMFRTFDSLDRAVSNHIHAGPVPAA